MAAARTTSSIERKKIKYYESINKLCLPPFFPSLYLCRLVAFILPFRFAVISARFFIHFAAKPNTAEQCPEVLSSIFNGLVYHCVWSSRIERNGKTSEKPERKGLRTRAKLQFFCGIETRNSQSTVEFHLLKITHNLPPTHLEGAAHNQKLERNLSNENFSPLESSVVCAEIECVRMRCESEGGKNQEQHRHRKIFLLLSFMKSIEKKQRERNLFPSDEFENDFYLLGGISAKQERISQT